MMVMMQHFTFRTVNSVPNVKSITVSIVERLELELEFEELELELTLELE